MEAVMTARQKHTPTAGAENAHGIGACMIVASRYEECLHRLARQAQRAELPELTEMIGDVARTIEAISEEIAFGDQGTLGLGRADRLVATVEALLEKSFRQGLLGC
jgi:hypothetical protein